MPELIIFSLLLLEEWLLVGTKQGHLLLYRIKKDVGKLIVRMTQEVDYITFISFMSDVVVILTQICVIDDFPYLEFKECVRSLIELYTLFIR